MSNIPLASFRGTRDSAPHARAEASAAKGGEQLAQRFIKLFAAASFVAQQMAQMLFEASLTLLETIANLVAADAQALGQGVLRVVDPIGDLLEQVMPNEPVILSAGFTEFGPRLGDQGLRPARIKNV